MSDPRTDRRAYLERVATRLRLHPASEADVLDELDDHIAESVAALRDAGLAPELAEREALARLGDPGELADGIRHARQTRRRLLVAAGYGVWAAVGGAFWGYVFAFAVVMLSAIMAMELVNAVIQQLQVPVSGWDTWTSLLSIPYAAFVSVYAGRSVPPVVARRSERPVRSLTRSVALVGGLVIAFLALVAIRIPLDQVTVIVLLLIPVGFALGARTASERDGLGGRLRFRGRSVVKVILLSTVALTALGIATLRIETTGTSPEPSPVVDRIGPPASDVLGEAWVGYSSSWTLGSPLDMQIAPEPADALSGWRDLRAEVWPAADDEHARIDPSALAPTLTTPLVAQDGGGWSGQVQAPVAKERAWFVITTSGVAPDGRRYVLTGPDDHLSSEPWVGSVWEWFTTP